MCRNEQGPMKTIMATSIGPENKKTDVGIFNKGKKVSGIVPGTPLTQNRHACTTAFTACFCITEGHPKIANMTSQTNGGIAEAEIECAQNSSEGRENDNQA
ncbi:hypothetical protein AVEN_240777-1 [Araneus ventricosus]|uniref:Uncharacterized protein n=1 Tax=Araneus ventricosus TaxID=182803 RepID=A0A4Y2SPM8_ARAVE|nr:hypothetical protein AVEN_240777-1 [Araneus ventricosus]